MRSFTEKLKATVGHFFDWSENRSESTPLKVLNEEKLSPPSQSFTDELIEKSPFSFEGTAEEKQKLINIYLAFSQTPEGKEQIKRLKSVFHPSVKIKMSFDPNLDKEGTAGVYNYIGHRITLNPNASDQMSVVLRHETDHALDYALPEFNKAVSIGQLFYRNKMTEVKAQANDVIMNFEHAHGQMSSLVQFYSERLALASKELPESPDKEALAQKRAKTDLIKLLWSGGAELPADSKLKRLVQNWNECYNIQAFQNTENKNRFMAFKQTPEADLKPFVEKLASAMDIHVDADFLTNPTWDSWRMGKGGVLSVQNNALLFQEENEALCWRVDEGTLKQIKTSPTSSCVSEYEQNTILHEGKRCRTMGTHLAKMHLRHIGGFEQITSFETEDLKNYIQQNILPNGQKLEPLKVVNNQPVKGVSVCFGEDGKIEMKKYQDGNLLNSSIFVGDKELVSLKDGKERRELKENYGNEEWKNLQKTLLAEYLDSSNKSEMAPKTVNPKKSLTTCLKEKSQENLEKNSVNHNAMASLAPSVSPLLMKQMYGKMEK